ncbi:MAG: sugar transferase [Acidobacteriaceae bacterium]|nr:sugar transferase [Acidobacteriaceae bacterium]
MSAYQRWGKRVLDLCVALPSLLLLLPVFFFCAVAVGLDSRGPILFRHIRVGRFGRPFRLLKFRTMVHQAAGKGSNLTVSGDPRITRSGQYLRRSKLDEIPQLLNVIAGHMSLVGPRPEVPEYVALYNPEQAAVLQMRPGITGAASVVFDNEELELSRHPLPHEYYVRTLMPRKLALDLSYASAMCFKTDVKLLASTARKILGAGLERFRRIEVTPTGNVDKWTRL